MPTASVEQNQHETNEDDNPDATISNQESHTFENFGCLPSSILNLLPKVHPASMLVVLPSNWLEQASLSHNQLVLVNRRIATVLSVEKLLGISKKVPQIALLSPCLYYPSSNTTSLIITNFQTSNTRSPTNAKSSASVTVTVAPIQPRRLYQEHASRAATLTAQSLRLRDVAPGDILPVAPRLYMKVISITGRANSNEPHVFNTQTRIAVQLARASQSTPVSIPEAIYEWTSARWHTPIHWVTTKEFSKQLLTATRFPGAQLIMLIGEQADVRDIIDSTYALSVRTINTSEPATIAKAGDQGECVLLETPINADEVSSILHVFSREKEPLLHYLKPFSELTVTDNTQHQHLRLLISCRNEEEIDTRLLALASSFIRIPTADDEERRKLLCAASDAEQAQHGIKDKRAIDYAHLSELVRMSTLFARRHVWGLGKVYGTGGLSACTEAVKIFARGRVSVETGGVTWTDVGGMQEAKETISELVYLSKKNMNAKEDSSRKQKKRNANRRVGVLLYGEPGTGKTLLARAVANESGFSFISVKGPELLNMYVGESEKNVREVFERAAAAAPCVIFFDELDALAPSRGKGSDSGGVSDRVVSQLMAELDQVVASGAEVFIIAASNRPDLVDPGLLRPGRLDKLVYVSMPQTRKEQMIILKAQTRKFRMDEKIDFERVLSFAPPPPIISGADIYAMASNAWMNAAKRVIEDRNFDESDVEKDECVESVLNVHRKHVVGMEERMKEYEEWFDEEKTTEQSEETAVLQEYSDLESPVCVTENDFVQAAQSLTPSLTLEQLKQYQLLRKQIESSQ